VRCHACRKIDALLDRGNIEGTISVVSSGFRLPSAPSDSSQIPETTFAATFDSLRAHHLYAATMRLQRMSTLACVFLFCLGATVAQPRAAQGKKNAVAVSRFV